MDINNIVYKAKNIIDSYYIFTFFLIAIIILSLFHQYFGSLKFAIEFFSSNSFSHKPLLFAVISLALYILFLIHYLYQIFNFKILITPDMLILKYYFNCKYLPLKSILKIERIQNYKDIKKIQITTVEGKTYIYPLNCDIEKLGEIVHKFNPDIQIIDCCDWNEISLLKSRKGR